MIRTNSVNVDYNPIVNQFLIIDLYTVLLEKWKCNSIGLKPYCLVTVAGVMLLENLCVWGLVVHNLLDKITWQKNVA